MIRQVIDDEAPELLDLIQATERTGHFDPTLLYAALSDGPDRAVLAHTARPAKEDEHSIAWFKGAESGGAWQGTRDANSHNWWRTPDVENFAIVALDSALDGGISGMIVGKRFQISLSNTWIIKCSISGAYRGYDGGYRSMDTASANQKLTMVYADRLKQDEERTGLRIYTGRRSVVSPEDYLAGTSLKIYAW